MVQKYFYFFLNKDKIRAFLKALSKILDELV